MGRRKKEESLTTKLSLKEHLEEETLRGVLSVVFFALGLFFILAAIPHGVDSGGVRHGMAGPVGDTLFEFFKLVFGYGYYLLPILLFTLCVSYFQSIKKNFAGIQTIGSILFFLSSLGLITVMSDDAGGIAGKLVAHPLISLVDVYATSIILVALLVISFLITFDTTLKLNFLTVIAQLLKKKPLEHKPVPGIAPIQLPESHTMTSEDSTPKLEKMKELFKKKDSEEIKDKDEDFAFMKPRSISLKPFIAPPLSLLEKDSGKPGVGDVKANANIIKRTLQNFGIIVEMDEVTIGPSVTRYALKPAEGVKLSRILGLQNNLELALAAHPVRIEAPIPGKSLVGIEIPNTTKTTVGLGSLLAEPEFASSDKALLVSLGKGISGKSHFSNLAKMPHLLIAGATGSGKSVTIHAIIASLLFRNPPDNLKLIMIDPKRVELTLYNKIPHLLGPVITDAKKAIMALKWAAREMDRRYDLLGEHSVRDIDSYHKTILGPVLDTIKKNGGKSTEGEAVPETMPYMVIIIDELADIMQAFPRELESAIVRLAQMSRAVGIHLILSTQRPSVNVITGLIKANVPSRIALQVASQIDSRTILDQAGAEKLLGAGDMLYMSGEMSKPERVQSAFITENEVKKLVKFLIEQYEGDIPEEIDFMQGESRGAIFEAGMDGDDDDDLYEDAREVVVAAGKASTSYLQRKLGVGYARAARIMDMLEERGVIGPGSGSKPREVLEKGSSGMDDGPHNSGAMVE